MNQAQRGIAAYRAVSGAAKAKPKGKARPTTALEVSVELGGVRPQTATTAQPKRAPERHETPKLADAKVGPQTEGLLRVEAGTRGYRKVAKFLLLLGQDEAAKILRHFTPEEIEGISREITRIRSIDDAEAKGLLKEFRIARKRVHSSKAGPETARAMLVEAFGEARGTQLFRRVVPRSDERPFQFLNDLDPEQIHFLLKYESAPAVSAILPHLNARTSAKVLERLPAELQREVIRRIAKMERVDQEVINRIEGVLKERIRKAGTVVTEEIDGRNALAEILKHMDLSAEEKILDDLAGFDPELSNEVKDRVFTIDIVFKVDPTDLQAVLRDYDDREIATILKAKEPKLVERFMKNLSSRRGAIIEEEIAHLGKMRKRDVDKSTKEFIDYLIELDDQHKITIHWDDRLVE